MIKVCISGLGRTGKEIAKVLLEQKDISVVAAICSPISEKRGKDLGDVIGVEKTDIIVESSKNLEEVVLKTKPDVMVDFTNPEASIENVRIASRLKISSVVGTTGFTPEQINTLILISKQKGVSVIHAPNITLGVNVLMLLTNLAATILNNYDFHITETHHKHKKDAPSGTAKKIANEIEKGLIASNSMNYNESVPITAIRAGGVVGRHEVMIFGEEDKIEIIHESFSRRAFAMGAIKAVKFAVGKKGFYEMRDVLNLKEILQDYIDNETAIQLKRYS